MRFRVSQETAAICIYYVTLGGRRARRALTSYAGTTSAAVGVARDANATNAGGKYRHAASTIRALSARLHHAWSLLQPRHYDYDTGNGPATNVNRVADFATRGARTKRAAYEACSTGAS